MIVKNKKTLKLIATHKRSYNLEMLYNANLTICPFSVEIERAFSLIGTFLQNLELL